MPRLEFDPKISLGNIITIAVVFVGAVTAWTTVVIKQAQLTEKLIILETSANARSDGSGGGAGGAGAGAE